MGIYRTSYLGPWLLINMVPYEVTHTKTVHTCKNIECDNCKQVRKLSGAFCNACGGQLGSVIINFTKKQTLNLWDFADDNGFDIDDFWMINTEFSNTPKNCEVLVENDLGYLHNLGLPKINDESLYVEMEDLDIPKLKEAFVKKHKEFIDVLSEKIGKENIQIKFGVLDNFS